MRKYTPAIKGGETCAYCGEAATGYDHFIPYCLAGENTPLYPACIECNSIAGSRVFDSLSAKRSYIHARLRKRYKAAIRSADWTQDELSQLEPKLKSIVIEKLRLREVIIRRLSFRLPQNYGEAKCKCCKSVFSRKRDWQSFCCPDCRINYFRGTQSRLQRGLKD